MTTKTDPAGPTTSDDPRSPTQSSVLFASLPTAKPTTQSPSVSRTSPSGARASQFVVESKPGIETPASEKNSYPLDTKPAAAPAAATVPAQPRVKRVLKYELIAFWEGGFNFDYFR